MRPSKQKQPKVKKGLSRVLKHAAVDVLHAYHFYRSVFDIRFLHHLLNTCIVPHFNKFMLVLLSSKCFDFDLRVSIKGTAQTGKLSISFSAFLCLWCTIHCQISCLRFVESFCEGSRGSWGKLKYSIRCCWHMHLTEEVCQILSLYTRKASFTNGMKRG